jgi:PKD repeat protein
MIDGTTENSYTDSNVTAGKVYYYKVIVEDQSTNTAESNIVNAVPTSDDTQKPVAVAGEAINGVIGKGIRFDASNFHDNVGITRYEWDFGDGAKGSMAQCEHIYSDEGLFTVTLTVYDAAGNSNECNLNVKILDDSIVTELTIKVVDSDSKAIPNALLCIGRPDNTTLSAKADEKGEYKIFDIFGSYKISAYLPHYEPAMTTCTIEKGKPMVANITLKKGEIVEGRVEVSRMTFDQIKDAGIEVNNPDNQYVYNVKIHLVLTDNIDEVYDFLMNGEGEILYINPLSSKQHSVTPSRGGGGGYAGGEGSNSGGGYVPASNGIGGQSISDIGYLIMPGGLKWEKEFFEVTLLIQNKADAAFDIVNSKAVLNIPSGITFVSANNPTYSKTEVAEMGTIGGGTSKTAKWVVRGDTSGDYTVGVDFSGYLKVLDQMIYSSFKSNTFHVYGSNTVKMHIEADDYAYEGEDYYTSVSFENKSAITMNNMSYNIEDSIDVGGLSFPVNLTLKD